MASLSTLQTNHLIFFFRVSRCERAEPAADLESLPVDFDPSVLDAAVAASFPVCLDRAGDLDFLAVDLERVVFDARWGDLALDFLDFAILKILPYVWS